MSLPFEDLWESERCVWHRIESGIPTDLRTNDPQQDDPTVGKAWPMGRTVRAAVLIELLTTDRRAGERRPRALHLVGARIMGGLDFSGLTLVCPLTLEGCHLGKRVSFDEARAPRVELSSCHVETFTARQFNTRGDLALRMLTATQVGLLGARIGGQLDLSGARLANPGGPALSADGLQVEQDVFCRVWNSEGSISRFYAKGEVSLHGARIGGQLDLSGAKLVANLDGPALSAGGLRVDQSMFCARFDAQDPVSGAAGVPRRRTPRRPRTAARGEPFMASGEVNLLGARIGGQLDFSGAQFANPDGPTLSADRLQVDQDMFCREQFTASGEVSLLGAQIGGQLDFSGARLVAHLDRPAISADGLQVDQGMLCSTWGSVGRPRRFYAKGEIRLAGAHIRGSLNLEGATLRNRSGPALDADGLRVDQDMLCGPWESEDRSRRRRFFAEGDVRLPRAHIGGKLNFDEATLCKRSDADSGRDDDAHSQALRGDRLRVDEGMFCRRGFTAKGQVRLPRAYIGGQLNFDGATLKNACRPALYAHRLRVDQDMFCGKWSPNDKRERFYAEGEIRLLGAQIGGQLSFGGANLTKPHRGVSLYLERAEAVELWLPHHTPPEGIVDLTDARVAQLYDEWRRPAQEDGHPFRYDLRINGFVYESLPEGSDSRSRLDWIKRAEQESARAERASGQARAKRPSTRIAQPKEDESGYLPGAYDQLAAVFRSAGREEDAREVAIEKLRRRRRKLPWPARAWNFFLEKTVGYGYRTWRAVYALLGLMALGWAVSAQASWDNLTETRAQRPQFQPLLYSIDVVLPVISLGQESAWSPTGLFFQAWYALSVLAGWVFATALVAALTAALFRE